MLYVAAYSSAQQQVDRKGLTAKAKLEQVISGYLTELNGKYKLRVTEITLEPGGYQGEHHQVGPGIRYVASGELTYIQADKTTIFKAGDYFYESGNVTHTVSNKGNSLVFLINFEVLQADWKGPTAVPPKSR